MSEVVRFSISLEAELLERFDAFCVEAKYATRSEAIRQLLWEKLTKSAWRADSPDAVASLTLVYDHHRAKLTDTMIEIQHAHAASVVSSMHVHLNHDLCMELIALRGQTQQLQGLAAELSGLKGIRQAQLVVALAEDIGARESHTHPHDS